jgi:hypothetical protein
LIATPVPRARGVIGMTSPRAKGIALVVLLVASFVGLFRVSIRLADPLFTLPFHAEWKHPVLLVWPDHVEIRWFDHVSEVSPRPKGEDYTFNVAPDRQAWIESKVRSTTVPGVDAGYTIHVKQLGPSRQRIQLDSLGDGISGIIYEAKPEEILPLHSRASGPAGALTILMVHLLLWGGLWLLVWLIFRVLRGRFREPPVVV